MANITYDIYDHDEDHWKAVFNDEIRSGSCLLAKSESDEENNRNHEETRQLLTPLALLSGKYFAGNIGETDAAIKPPYEWVTCVFLQKHLPEIKPKGEQDHRYLMGLKSSQFFRCSIRLSKPITLNFWSAQSPRTSLAWLPAEEFDEYKKRGCLTYALHLNSRYRIEIWVKIIWLQSDQFINIFSNYSPH